ncbi:SRPBCC domain-containing protein [Antrihabitans sp. NCIMB 15449]|uniref:SRPBCC domain-containing protein n=1 Tax=Antrihabitans spumae TaxID=3373370 RepID=A0ABW7JVA9_9NOCA
MTEPVIIETTIAAPAATVWPALRDPDLIRRWHGWHYDGLDAEIDTIFLTGGTESEDYTLSLGEDVFTLHEDDGVTTVRITRAPKGNNPEWDEWYDDITEGWTTFLEQLRFGIEVHALAVRRTLMLEGRLDVEPREALGLTVTAEVGRPYQADMATADVFDGVVRLVAPHQIAVTVEQLGPGLLIVGDQPRNQQRPLGGSMLVLTSYGLTEAAHDELAQRWQSWWDSHRVAAVTNA